MGASRKAAGYETLAPGLESCGGRELLGVSVTARSRRLHLARVSYGMRGMRRELQGCGYGTLAPGYEVALRSELHGYRRGTQVLGVSLVCNESSGCMMLASGHEQPVCVGHELAVTHELHG